MVFCTLRIKWHYRAPNKAVVLDGILAQLSSTFWPVKSKLMKRKKKKKQW